MLCIHLIWLHAEGVAARGRVAVVTGVIVMVGAVWVVVIGRIITVSHRGVQRPGTVEIGLHQMFLEITDVEGGIEGEFAAIGHFFEERGIGVCGAQDVVVLHSQLSHTQVLAGLVDHHRRNIASLLAGLAQFLEVGIAHAIGADGWRALRQSDRHLLLQSLIGGERSESGRGRSLVDLGEVGHAGNFDYSYSGDNCIALQVDKFLAVLLLHMLYSTVVKSDQVKMYFSSFFYRLRTTSSFTLLSSLSFASCEYACSIFYASSAISSSSCVARRRF